MAYYLDLFSPETHAAFSRSDRSISGVRYRQRNMAQRVQPGDKLICYMTKLSRWCGLLEVLEGPFIDNRPIFYPEDDPFVVRFRVGELVWLPLEKTIPIHEDHVWNQLSFTRDRAKSSLGWAVKFRQSLTPLEDADGKFLENLLRSQLENNIIYPVDPELYRKLSSHQVRRMDKDVRVTVPEEPEEEAEQEPTELRESIQIQALLVEIGSRMGMQVWVPPRDRSRVLEQIPGEAPPLLERLPLNYNEATLKTIEQIDVLWLKGRAIRRAFEVEHSTSIYSGILRMADLLALQPNMDIRLHIVAPDARREKVFQELRRPVFSLLERGPLSESCTYLSYESVRELAKLPHLAHLSDSVLEEYEEEAED